MSVGARLIAALGLWTPIPRRKHAAGAPLAALARPERVTLAIAGLTEVVVAAGDQVYAGQLVARTPASTRWQRRAHASLAGRVHSLTDGEIVIIAGATAAPAPASPRAPHRDPAGLAPADIISSACEAGLVGLGGGMFPTYLKLSPHATPIDTVLINGCESEPYFTCDHRVLHELREEVECGLQLAMAAVGAPHGLIIDRETYYPAGYERFVVRDVLGREIPERGLPRDVGALVLNVQSARALHRAVCQGWPLVDRVVTVAGEAVARPGNYHVLCGDTVGHVLAECGFDQARAAALVVGGPMMGHPATADTLITAGTGGVLALSAREIAERAEQPCLRCGRCFDACPMGLPVAVLVERPTEDVLHCIECGACQYVCPSAIPLVARLREAKVKELAWD